MARKDVSLHLGLRTASLTYSGGIDGRFKAAEFCGNNAVGLAAGQAPRVAVKKAIPTGAGKLVSNFIFFLIYVEGRAAAGAKDGAIGGTLYGSRGQVLDWTPPDPAQRLSARWRSESRTDGDR